MMEIYTRKEVLQIQIEDIVLTDVLLCIGDDGTFLDESVSMIIWRRNHRQKVCKNLLDDLEVSDRCDDLPCPTGLLGYLELMILMIPFMGVRVPQDIGNMPAQYRPVRNKRSCLEDITA